MAELYRDRFIWDWIIPGVWIMTRASTRLLWHAFEASPAVWETKSPLRAVSNCWTISRSNVRSYPSVVLRLAYELFIEQYSANSPVSPTKR